MNITVLKVAHHGSRNVTSDDFLKLVHPQAAVISAGVDNLYGHPHKETIQRISSCNPCPDIYRTDLAGEVSIRWEKKKEKWNMFVQVYREKSACPTGQHDFWHCP
jgi:competence protein ComEC